MKTVVFAYHEMGCAGIRALIQAGYQISAVFTHAETPGSTPFYGSVARVAAEYGIPVYAPEEVNHPLWVERLKALSPEYLFTFSYRQTLSDEILATASVGAFNTHASLLPAYRGRAHLNWVLINGETQTGVTLHRITAQPDAGPILAQQAVAISAEDNALSLHNKLCKTSADLLPGWLTALKNHQLSEQPQDESRASCPGGRKPEDGQIHWTQSAEQVHNLVRALSEPWPGAFAYTAGQRFVVWQSRVRKDFAAARPGTVLAANPLVIACGQDALEIVAGQVDNGIYQQGHQLAASLGLVERALLTGNVVNTLEKPVKVLILGVNGFIGNHLTERLLREPRYEVYGLDIGSDAISRFIDHPRFHFVEGDISIHSEWIEYHIKKCDVVLPLVAIATPIEYTRNPLRVFELDFEENLKIIRHCVKYHKRVIFPSTSEVYGMCQDASFDEDSSNLVVGPINKQRWIYSVSKQLLDRVIWAYGDKEGLKFTLFRPFNWMGPRLDNLDAARIGSSRAITQLILNLVEGTPIKLIDGGSQKRCFTDIRDGIEALFRIVENKEGKCDGQIINIGNPDNEASIKELAETLLASFEQHPLRDRFPPFAGFRDVESSSYYGKGYQDVEFRKPSIANAQQYINWTPDIALRETIDLTLDFFLQGAAGVSKE